MRINLLATAVAVGLLAVSCGNAPQEPRTIKIVQYNVGVFYKSGESTLNMVADMMKEVGADVVSLNELDSCARRTGGVDELKDFAAAMGGWNYRYSKALDFQGGGYGIGVAGAEKPVATYAMTLEQGDGSEQRALAVMEFKDYVVASAHLEYSSAAAQYNQAKIATEWLQAKYGDTKKPVFFCGDMNAFPESETIAYLRKNFYLLTPLADTFPSHAPDECIDYIFALRNGAAWTLKGCKVLDSFESGDVAVASDHLPIMAEVELAEADFSDFFTHKDFVLEAHRGLSNKFPENTELAFREAGKIPAYGGMETDVAFSQDRVLICMHDFTLDRTTDGTGLPKEYLFEELQKLNITGGYGWSEQFEDAGLRIPEFRTYLQVCKETGLIPYVELKSVDNEAIDAVVAMLHEEGFTDADYVLTSFFKDHLLYAMNISEAPLEYMKNPFTEEDVKACLGLKNWVIRPNSTTIDGDFVDFCHHLGFPVECWALPVGDGALLDNLHAWGVHGVTCNDWEF